MNRDIRKSSTYDEVRSLLKKIRHRDSLEPYDFSDLSVNADGTIAFFTAYSLSSIDEEPLCRVFQIDLTSEVATDVSLAGKNARFPRCTPCGDRIAYVSDQNRPGHMQLNVISRSDGTTRAVLDVTGRIEAVQWSPSGDKILLCVAAPGADVSSSEGAMAIGESDGDLPGWIPEVDTSSNGTANRHAWIWSIADNSARRIETGRWNIWEACWQGSDAIVVVASDGSNEGSWYDARLYRIDLQDDTTVLLYQPADQIAGLTCTPSGDRIAFIEALCSDRLFVAGDVKIVDARKGTVRRLCLSFDVSYIEWRSESRLLFAGHRGLETTIVLYDLEQDSEQRIWSSRTLSTAGVYARVCGINAEGDCALIGEGFARSPEIAVIRGGVYQSVHSFDQSYQVLFDSTATMRPIRWSAPDGLNIEGWLLTPRKQAPHRLVMQIHGGPVFHWRSRWLGRTGLLTLSLLQRDFAVFLPNPRGSSGRGQNFARRVIGDIGGRDMEDLLSGLDQLVNEGVTQQGLLGVTGISYGGFMTAWLVTQDDRFAAAVPVSPHTNQLTQHLLSNIPQFTERFIGGVPEDVNSNFFKRSPILFAQRVTTPTLNICGLRDRCTPATEAAQFHHSLCRHGAISALVSYPCEGHGIKLVPAMIDYVARTIDWFDTHVPHPEAVA